ncbi:MAG TPA: beta-ketoacyl-[acyl-carrier-protein] synthase family protein [Nitrospirota bacterium]|nr:beta-ketoacyl-[acyl-carrier-protein] synthase family protein [Nitrospirota bacterium]
MRNVVITGIGVLSPIGIGKEPFWDALAAGRTGFRPVTLFDTSSFRTNIAGEITDFDPLALLGKKGLRDLDRSTRLLCSAAKLAIEDGKLEITGEKTHTTGVAVGATYGSLHSISQFDRTAIIEGPRAVNPSHFPNTVLNSPASQVSIRFNIKGFNTTVSTGFCASLDAAAYAADFIRFNRADAVLAGGVEELCEETFMYFHALGYLSGADSSTASCCPFDARRKGTILSEAAAVLVLEDEQTAAQRNAAVLARFRGYANAFDPSAKENFHGTGAGLKRAVLLALEDASLAPEDIDYICACSNGSPELDRTETAVIKSVFGSHAYATPVSSIKSMVGEAYSASGALALSAAVGALHRNLIPPTMNFQLQDPECDLDCVPNKAKQHRVQNVLITAVDPYGQSSAAVLGK